jgi:hypothetical protein
MQTFAAEEGDVSKMQEVLRHASVTTTADTDAHSDGLYEQR